MMAVVKAFWPFNVRSVNSIGPWESCWTVDWESSAVWSRVCDWEHVWTDDIEWGKNSILDSIDFWIEAFKSWIISQRSAVIAINWNCHLQHSQSPGLLSLHSSFADIVDKNEDLWWFGWWFLMRKTPVAKILLEEELGASSCLRFEKSINFGDQRMR